MLFRFAVMYVCDFVPYFAVLNYILSEPAIARITTAQIRRHIRPRDQRRHDISFCSFNVFIEAPHSRVGSVEAV